MLQCPLCVLYSSNKKILNDKVEISQENSYVVSPPKPYLWLNLRNCQNKDYFMGSTNRGADYNLKHTDLLSRLLNKDLLTTAKHTMSQN